VAEKTLLRAVIDATGLSRRKAFDAIRAGRVSEDGEARTEPSAAYTGGDLRLDGAPLAGAAPPLVYLVVNKPAGIVTTTRDELGRPTVLDLVPSALRAPGLHPVGRLDRDATGLLVLTNDGKLTYRLTHPSHEIEKEYWVATSEPLSADRLRRLRFGVWLGGRLRRPLRLRTLPASASPFHLSIVIAEGRKHQVKQMIGALGGKVVRLKRVREGELDLGDLPEGAVRRLSPHELALLAE
jgi:pseudouridine synthase